MQHNKKASEGKVVLTKKGAKKPCNDPQVAFVIIKNRRLKVAYRQIVRIKRDKKRIAQKKG